MVKVNSQTAPYLTVMGETGRPYVDTWLGATCSSASVDADTRVYSPPYLTFMGETGRPYVDTWLGATCSSARVDADTLVYSVS